MMKNDTIHSLIQSLHNNKTNPSFSSLIKDGVYYISFADPITSNVIIKEIKSFTEIENPTKFQLVIFDIKTFRFPIQIRPTFFNSVKSLLTKKTNIAIIIDQNKADLFELLKFFEGFERIRVFTSIEQLLEILETNTPISALPENVDVPPLHDDEKMVIQSISHMASKFVWDNSFKPIKYKYNGNPFQKRLYELINILQNVFFEFSNELKSLNRKLQLKIAEQYVDIKIKESNLRAILNNSDSFTCLVDKNYILIECNHQFSSIFEYMYNQVPKTNQNILSFIPKQDRKLWKSRIDNAISGIKVNFEEEVLIPGNKKFYIEVKMFPIVEENTIIGTSIFIKDITKPKKAHEELIYSNNELKKVNKELDSFVYSVSHDLKAPLTSIKGLIHLWKIENNPKIKEEIIDRIGQSAEKLELFIKDINDLSRNARANIIPQNVNIQKLLEGIFVELEYFKHRNEVEIYLSIHHDETEFYCDSNRLKVIFSNLITNAILYHDPKKGTPFIHLEVNISKKGLFFTIEDNGIGIEPNSLEKIFTIFYRAHEQSSGSGLGLYIVKETVERLNGTINVRSELNIGTTFDLFIPNIKPN